MSPAALAFLAAFAAAMLLAGVASASAHGTLYVSKTGSDSATARSWAVPAPRSDTRSSGFARTLACWSVPGPTCESANPGGGANVITPRLSGVTLTSNRAWGASAANTVIDAAGEPNGVLDQANKSTVSGFTVEHAQVLEGILVEPSPSSWPASPTASPANLSKVTIEDNVVERNDQAYDTTAPIRLPHAPARRRTATTAERASICSRRLTPAWSATRSRTTSAESSSPTGVCLQQQVGRLRWVPLPTT